jgi:6-phosphogluconolactonase
MEIRREIKVFPDNARLSRFAASKIGEIALDAVEARGSFHIVLSGGGTPTTLYKLLTESPFLAAFPWPQSHFYWGDERNVPPDEEGSNFGQAFEILLDRVPVPEANIHRIKGELRPEKAAADYADQLLAQATPGMDWPRFDVVLLGMGADGHTASLFPGQVLAGDNSIAIVPVVAHYGGRPARRLTLTPPVFNSARNIIFLVTGADKAAAVAATLEGAFDPQNKPTQRIQPLTGRILWVLDEGAAGKLSNL